MTLTQNLLNASAFARSAATATNTRMSEAQARRVISDIKRAQAELTQAKGVAIEEIRQGKERDRSDAADKAIIARSMEMRGRDWFAVAVEVTG